MLPLHIALPFSILAFIIYNLVHTSRFHLRFSDNIFLRRTLEEVDARFNKRVISALKYSGSLIRTADFIRMTAFLAFLYFTVETLYDFPWSINPLFIVASVFLLYAGGHFIPELLTTVTNKRYIVFSLKVLVCFHLLIRPLLFPVSYIIGKIGANEINGEEVDENERSVHARAYIESGKEKGFFLSDEEELLHSVVEFSDITVKEVMTPRVDMNYMHRDMPLIDAVALVKEHNKSRYPVYSKNIDDIIGIINIKEMFILWDSDDKKITIKDLTSLEPYFVPESKMVDDLLREMRQRHLKMCIVVDEYGGTAGLVTLEDLVEEIVGEIQDEYEDEENDIVENSDGSYTVLGKTDIDELEDLLGRSLEDESYETIGGMIFSELGRVPRVKEKINVKGLEITILAVDGRKIEKITVRKK